MAVRNNFIRVLVITLLYTNPAWTQVLLPTSTTSQVVKHTYYTLSYSEPNEQAEWVAYKLTGTMASGTQSRTDNFRPDPNLPTGSASLTDYKGTGYDRGHLCPTRKEPP